MTINGFSHALPNNVDVLLVGPAGQKLILMSDSAGSSFGSSVTNLVLTFDDATGRGMPSGGQLFSGNYRPTNSGSGDTFPCSRAASPFATTLSTFNGSDPNGVWSLYVVDDTDGNAGSIAGWS